jgi:hypothetical protein
MHNHLFAAAAGSWTERMSFAKLALTASVGPCAQSFLAKEISGISCGIAGSRQGTEVQAFV